MYNKLLFCFSLFTFLAFNALTGQDLKYIQNTMPTIKPELFCEGFISKDSRYEFGSIFNKKGTEFFFAIDSAGRALIKYTTIKDGKWIEPVNIISDNIYSFNDPFLSPDESKLYYISDKAKLNDGVKGNYDIWYSERIDGEWSEPINAGDEINSDSDEYYISFTNDGSMYYGSSKNSGDLENQNFDIFKSKYINGKFQKSKRLDGAINTNSYEADVFIAPDESYIIFCAKRKTGLGRGDLYISFKESDGSWTNAINMGTEINTTGHELCPFVTSDGKYFFYTSNKDIYWVSTTIFTDIKQKSKW